MADAERTIKILCQAAMQLRATRGRRGLLVDLAENPEATELVVAGDLHGQRDNFRAILRFADLAANPGRHLVLQELIHGSGRYPTGGDTSHQLLDLAAALVCQFPHRVHLLPGNHEFAEWTNRPIAKDGATADEVFREGIATAYGPQSEAVRAAYHGLIASMPLAVRTANRVFVSHSLPPAKRLATFDPSCFAELRLVPHALDREHWAYWLVWGRDTRPETAARFLKLVGADFLVSGHIAVEAGHAAPNPQQIILDCVGRPAGCVLLPTREKLTAEAFFDSVHEL